MTQKMKTVLCALLITAFSTGALAASESSSFAASHGTKARKTVVVKKHRHRRAKKNGVVAQNRNEGRKSRPHRKSRKGAKKNAPMPIIPGADDANA